MFIVTVIKGEFSIQQYCLHLFLRVCTCYSLLCVCRGEGNFENPHKEVIFEVNNTLKTCVKGAFSLPVVLSFVPNSNLRKAYCYL